MTPVSVPHIDITSLGNGHDLGRGGQGRVTAANGIVLNGQWAAHRGQRVPRRAGSAAGTLVMIG